MSIQPHDLCPVCHNGLFYRLYIDKAGKRYRRFECAWCGIVLLVDAKSSITEYTEWIKDAEKRHKESMANLRHIVAWFKGKDVVPPHGMKPLREGEPIPVLAPMKVTVERSKR
jgi:hypothetical protein